MIISKSRSQSSTVLAAAASYSSMALPVMRYSADELNRQLGDGFELVESVRELHVTPSGAEQSFVYCLWRLLN